MTIPPSPARPPGSAGQDAAGRGPFPSALLCLVALTAVGLVGLAVRQPLLFPSLGPTVMIFFDTPEEAAAAPRNALAGHGVALAAGASSLALFRLTSVPSVLLTGVTAPRIGAAAVSVALTTLVLRLLRAPHPPAGATTLIVSLGLLATAPDLLCMAVAILLVTVFGVALNRLAGTRDRAARPGHRSGL